MQLGSRITIYNRPQCKKSDCAHLADSVVLAAAAAAAAAARAAIFKETRSNRALSNSVRVNQGCHACDPPNEILFAQTGSL
jgi:hypothetical protein